MPTDPKNECPVFVSIEIASPRQMRVAFLATALSFAFLICALPFAKIPFIQVPPFITAYESALIICNLVISVLLFGQFSVFRTRALFILACGYSFIALIALCHLLTFPGAFSAPGLLGGGTQTPIRLYIIWHAGFPIFVILYALLKDGQRKEMLAPPPPHPWSPSTMILAGIATLLVAACGLTYLATLNQQFPILLTDTHFTSTFKNAIFACWMLSLFAFIILWRRRPLTVLDLWQLLVMVAWMLEIALSAMLNSAQYDIGWYTGRIFGLLSAGSLLIVLLTESATHCGRLVHLTSKLSTEKVTLEELSLQDGLTNVGNRRFFDKYLSEQVAIAHRYKRNLSLVMCDIDHFKSFNDHYGHLEGDECLKKIAGVLASCCRRPADMAARYGGEEFAMILPDTDLPGAVKTAEALREAVLQLRIPHAKSPASPFVTVSAGVAVLSSGDKLTARQLIGDADQVLYQAKHLGRNKVVCIQAEPAIETAIVLPS